MAVTITSNPGDYQPIGNRFEFGFTIDASGDGGDFVYSIGYQLFDEDDTAITDIEQIPYSAAEQFVDFENDIKPHIFTTLQDPGDAPILTFDSNAQKGFYVTYGQIEFDSAGCTTETSGVSDDSSEYLAINSAWDWYEEYDGLDAGDLVMLSDRPAYNEVTADQDIFVSMFREATDNIFVFRLNYDKDGNQIGSTVLNSVVSSGVHIYAMSAFPDTYTGIHHWQVNFTETIGGSPVIKEYNFLLSQCADSAIRELHWIEPKGSQSSIVFETVSFGGNQAAGSTFEKYVPSGLTNVQRGKDYGLSRSNVRTFRRVTFSKIMYNTPDLPKWLDGLFASSMHYVKYPLPDGTYIFAKFVIDSGSYEAYNENQLILTVSGSIHIPVNAL